MKTSSMVKKINSRRTFDIIKSSYLGRIFRSGGTLLKSSMTILFLGFFSILALLLATGGAQSEGKAEIKPIPVSIIDAKPNNIAPETVVYGRVENPNTTVLQASTLAYVKEVYVNEGQLVRRGELIVQLDPRDADVLVKQAHAAVMDAESLLNQLVAQQEADRINLRSQQELYELTKSKEARFEQLHHNGQLSITELEELKKQRLLQEIALNRQSLSVATQTSEMASAVARFENAQASHMQAQLNLERLSIKAPFDGRVTSLDAAIGRRVSAGQPVATVFDANSHQVRVSLSADVADDVHTAILTNQPVSAHALINSEWVELTFIEVSAEVRSGHAGTDILMSLPEENQVALGRALEVRVTLPIETDVIEVPVQSVYGDRIIYTVEKELLKAIAIEPRGSREDKDGNMLVLVKANGLQEGAPIVTSTLSRASSGTKVAMITHSINSELTPQPVSVTAGFVAD